ncbi:hypothetical protein SAMN05421881_10155 [Nitrosomonas halophila]|uniref:Uncharacterized protein n=1 Tax=Nitrosomonas halophila TaxID=44576 RepID=A0A1H3GGW0_9PROT|nr:hypothetical protein SAMN05421881_10155 [Nitrosomonas halophila]
MFVVRCSTTYHLLVETGDGNLIQGVRQLNGVGSRGNGAGSPIRCACTTTENGVHYTTVSVAVR